MKTLEQIQKERQRAKKLLRICVNVLRGAFYEGYSHALKWVISK